MNQVTISPILEKDRGSSQPAEYIDVSSIDLFSHHSSVVVINMMSKSSGGVEKPWTIPAVTKALIGCMPTHCDYVKITIAA
jgi:hypothetical protein